MEDPDLVEQEPQFEMAVVEIDVNNALAEMDQTLIKYFTIQYTWIYSLMNSLILIVIN